jgi:hypothetical protein
MLVCLAEKAVTAAPAWDEGQRGQGRPRSKAGPMISSQVSEVQPLHRDELTGQNSGAGVAVAARIMVGGLERRCPDSFPRTA